MIKIQADNIDDNFAELDLMRQNGWKELAVHVGFNSQRIYLDKKTPTELSLAL